MKQTKAMIAVSAALSVVATTLILPILSPLIRELHLSVSQGGLMLSIGSVVMVLAAPLWGKASDRYGRKMVIVAGFLGILVGYALYTGVVIAGLHGLLTVSVTFLALTASRAAVGAFLSSIPAGTQALMADITGAGERASGMAIISAATGLGLIAGPAVSGILSTSGITWPLFAAIAFCGLGAIIALVFLKDPPVAVSNPSPKTKLFSVGLQPWLLAGVVLWFAIATMQIVAGFYFQDRLGLDASATARMLSLALTLVGVAMFGVPLLQMRVLKLAPRALILAGASLWVAGLLVLLSTTNALSYYVGFMLLGLGAGCLLPGVMAGASLAVDHDGQGVAAGLVSATQGIGFIIAPAVSTVLYEWNETLPLWLLTALMALLVMKFAITRRVGPLQRQAVIGIDHRMQ